jgi:hypothetical protein
MLCMEVEERVKQSNEWKIGNMVVRNWAKELKVELKSDRLLLCGRIEMHVILL